MLAAQHNNNNKIFIIYYNKKIKTSTHALQYAQHADTHRESVARHALMLRQ